MPISNFESIIFYNYNSLNLIFKYFNIKGMFIKPLSKIWETRN